MISVVFRRRAAVDAATVLPVSAAAPVFTFGGGSVGRATRAISASTPPSPSLSARMT